MDCFSGVWFFTRIFVALPHTQVFIPWSLLLFTCTFCRNWKPFLLLNVPSFGEIRTGTKSHFHSAVRFQNFPLWKFFPIKIRTLIGRRVWMVFQILLSPSPWPVSQRNFSDILFMRNCWVSLYKIHHASTSRISHSHTSVH